MARVRWKVRREGKVAKREVRRKRGAKRENGKGGAEAVARDG
jgi:hypothetical protein